MLRCLLDKPITRTRSEKIDVLPGREDLEKQERAELQVLPTFYGIFPNFLKMSHFRFQCLSHSEKETKNRISIDRFKRNKPCCQSSGNRLCQICPDFYVVWILIPGFEGQGVHFLGSKSKIIKVPLVDQVAFG